MNRLKEIEERMSVLKTEIETEGADLNAIEKEIDSLNEERKTIKDKIEKRAALIKAVTESNDVEILKDFKEERGIELNKDQKFTVASKEYRSAFFKTLAEEELSDVEKRAFTHTTANTSALVPTETVNAIWSLIEEQHSILGDITMYRTGTVIEIPVHKAITAGDAKNVAEGVANDDEKNEFIKVTLSGKDFSKHVEISYALGRMNGVALESYLTTEIADRLGAVLAKEVVTQVLSDMDAGNKVTAAKAVPTWTELISAFGKIKNAGALTVYVANSTLYNALVGMVDTTGRPMFQNSMQEGVQGVLTGANVKIEEAIADGTILIGDPKKVAGNMVQDIMIESDKDIKRHVDIYSGYSRFECKLVNSKSFATVTVTPGA